jgi:hypothetical protein
VWSVLSTNWAFESDAFQFEIKAVNKAHNKTDNKADNKTVNYAMISTMIPDMMNAFYKASLTTLSAP